MHISEISTVQHHRCDQGLLVVDNNFQKAATMKFNLCLLSMVNSLTLKRVPRLLFAGDSKWPKSRYSETELRSHSWCLYRAKTKAQVWVICKCSSFWSCGDSKRAKVRKAQGFKALGKSPRVDKGWEL